MASGSWQRQGAGPPLERADGARCGQHLGLRTSGSRARTIRLCCFRLRSRQFATAAMGTYHGRVGEQDVGSPPQSPCLPKPSDSLFCRRVLRRGAPPPEPVLRSGHGRCSERMPGASARCLCSHTDPGVSRTCPHPMNSASPNMTFFSSGPMTFTTCSPTCFSLPMLTSKVSQLMEWVRLPPLPLGLTGGPGSGDVRGGEAGQWEQSCENRHPQQVVTQVRPSLERQGPAVCSCW